MAQFYFPPNEEVEIHPNNKSVSRLFPDMTYFYDGRDDKWYIKNPKTSSWIPFMQEGVPEIYRAQVLLLVAAYPD